MTRVPDRFRLWAAAVAFVSLVFGGTELAAQSLPATATASPRTIVGTVDIAAVIAFHPAMREFEFHVGRFLAPVAGNPPGPGGWVAWSNAQLERRRILALETSIQEASLQQIARRTVLDTPDADERRVAAQQELARGARRLADLRQQRDDLLRNLTARIVGEPSSDAFRNASPEQLQRIMTEIATAVARVAREQGAALVFNTMGGGTSTGAPDTPGTWGPDGYTVRAWELNDPCRPDILERFAIGNLGDLEHVARMIAAGESATPGSTPQSARAEPPAPSRHPGGNRSAASIRAFLKEAYANRMNAARVFIPVGARQMCWPGTQAIETRDLTALVVGELCDTYHIPAAERETALAILRGTIPVVPGAADGS